MAEVKSSGPLAQLESAIEGVNAKLPQLPDSAKEVIAQITPWAILIIAILFIPAILAIFGFGSLFGSFSLGFGLYHFGAIYYITWAITVITFIMELSAVSGLIKRKIGAWRLLFYVALLEAVSNLINLSIVSLIISLAITLYLLFQIKKLYS